VIQRRFDVTLTHGAASAYSIARLTVPHVVIVDAGDPDVDALELCRRLRADRLDVPVLVVDEHGTIDGLLAAFEAGADAYLRGPIDGSELRAHIGALARRYLAGSPHARSDLSAQGA
jgi:two-component system OmpR family response regulator